MVSIDFYLNETTRHAHIILPPTFALERSHYDLVFHALAVRNTVRHSPPLYPKPAGALHDWEILLELSARVEAARGRRLGLAFKRRLLHALGPDGLLALLLRLGPYGSRLPFGAGFSLGRVAKAVHGLDLGPLRPALPERLGTKGRRIDLAPARLVADLDRLQARLPALSAPERPAPRGPPRPAQQQLVDAQLRATREGPRPLHPAHAPRRRRRPAWRTARPCG